MNVTYVSCLYNIYESNTISERLSKDVQILLKQNIKLILYVDEFFFDVIKSMEMSKEIIIIKYPIFHLEIYSKIIKQKDSLTLPSNRNLEKDTCEYMALMNSKVELIHKSLSLVTTPYVGWIDAGISKIFKMENTLSRICNLNIVGLDNILIPGSYSKKLSFEDLNKTIWWNYLGGFFICNKDIVLNFYSSCLNSINYFLEKKCMVWEVNMWVHVNNIHEAHRAEIHMAKAQAHKLFEWYHGDHNDTIINIPATYLSSGDNLKKRAKDARWRSEHLLSYNLSQEVLEIEKDPFSTVYEDLSIVSYYLGKKEEGRIAAERVLASPHFNGTTKNQVLANIVFYLLPLQKITKGTAQDAPREITFSLPTGYFPSSPCIINFGDSYNPSGIDIQTASKYYICNLRAVNYRIRPDGSYDVKDPNNIVRTKNFILKLDENFNHISSYELSDNLSIMKPHYPSRILGLEDIRVFLDKNGNKYFFATSCETLPQFCPRIVFGSWNDDGQLLFLKALKIPESLNNTCEKNWLPFVTDSNEIHFIYKTSPLTIYKIDRETFEVSLVSLDNIDAKTNLIDKETETLTDITERKKKVSDYEFRGSASLISHNLNGEDGWLCTIHQVLYSTPRKYYHRFLWYSKDFSKRKYGSLFYFEKIGIEYNLSICKSLDAKNIILGYSINDGCAKILTVPIENINKDLEFSSYLISNYKDSNLVKNSDNILNTAANTTNKKAETVELMKDIITDVVKSMDKIKDRKICLCMIVKNESKIIKRCLQSCLPILDYISICDTGSTDNTVEIINDFCKENNIPGKVHNHVWKNFGHNRTLSYTTARETFPLADYCLLIDADMSLKVLPGFDKSSLDAGGYLVAQLGGSLYYFNTRLLGTKYNWKCIGVTHEYWSAENPLCVSKQLTTLEMDDFGDGGAKGDKFERDIKLLTQGLIDEPGNERYMFYLAQTYHDIGQYGTAIKWYRKRIAKGGWYEEVYYSYYRIARCKLGMKRSWGEIQQAYEEAHKYLPSRMEPVFEIGKYYQEKENYPEAYKWLIQASKIPFPSSQVLFLFKDIYEFRVWDALGIAAFYIGQYQVAVDSCIKALKSSFCNSERDRIKTNMKFSLDKLRK